MRVHRLLVDIQEFLGGHTDNTGAPCREDLLGHDCCYTCNAVQEMLVATIEHYTEVDS